MYLTLQDIVFKELDSAKDNGYVFEYWTARRVATDMIEYSSEFENETEEDLIPHIILWRELNE